MKKLLCILVSAAMLALSACGTQSAPDGTPVSPDTPVTTAEVALPESCRLYFDAAETGGASDRDDGRPFSARADEGLSDVYAIRMPDGSYTDLKTLDFGEGVSLEAFSGGGAERLDSTHALAWEGEKYYSFSVGADNCAIPNLSPDTGGILRLDISGDCWVDGGGEEYAVFEGFDCVLVTGSGSLTIRDTSGLGCGGGGLPVPALIIDGDVEVYADSVYCAPNEGCTLSAVVLRGALYTGRLDTGGGDVLVADGLLLARGLTGAPNAVFRGGTALIDDMGGEPSTFILSGGEAYISGDIPEGTAVESGAGTLCAGNIALAQVNGDGAELLDRDADGSRYLATVYSGEWFPERGAAWNSLSAYCVGGKYYFAGTAELDGSSAGSLNAWGALHAALSGSSTVDELGASRLLFTGDGELTVRQCGVWGWGAVHGPVMAVLDGASVTVLCDEFALGSEAGEEGFFLADGGSFTANDLWLQNSVLEVRSGTLHVKGNLSMERGSILVTGGTLVVDGSIWLGEGSVTLTGGELIIPGGVDAVALDAGELTQSGGTVREP